MNTAEVIERALRGIRDQFYPEDAQGVRAFARDRNALTKAICRYGAACDARGWRFDEGRIISAILKLLPQIKAPDHQYLPVYLEKCIDRHVGQRAEELQAESLKYENQLRRTMAEARSKQLPGGVVAVPVTATEQMAALWGGLRDLQRRKKAQAKAQRAQPKIEQAALL